METGFAFDFDGVILDSLESLREAYFEFLSDFGVTGSNQEFDFLNGPSLSEIVEILRRRYGLEGTHRELLSKYNKLLDRKYADASLICGATECLLAVKAMGFPLALVTSSGRDLVDTVLQRHHLASLFDCIITGDEVKASKPSPEIYLELRARIPEHTWVAIEDSENGIESSNSAGLKTIFFDPYLVGTVQEVLSRVTCMAHLIRRIQEFQHGSCVVETNSQIQIEVLNSSAPRLDQATEVRVEEIWDSAIANSLLQDSQVLYYARHESLGGSCKIFAFWGSYRFFYAKQSDPLLPIPYFPLAVSGVCLRNDNHVLLGKRINVTEYDNQWETVPSGGINISHFDDPAVDFLGQLNEELSEETAFRKENISSVTPVGLLVDLEHGVFDVGCLVRIEGNSLNPVPNSGEYGQFEWCDLDKPLPRDVVPTSVALLNLLC